MGSALTPKRWWEVYQGDKECRFFKAISRGKHEWRTTDGIMKETKLLQKEVETIVHKYLPLGIIQQHSNEAGKFRYWENASPPKKQDSISDADKKKRVEEKLAGTNANP